MDSPHVIVSGASIFLIVNSLWDFLCVSSLLLHIPPLRSIHTAIWKDENDTYNPAACHLMACLVFVWGWMRLAAGVWGAMEWACISYLIEGFVFGSGVLSGRMLVCRGGVVSLLSLILAVVFYYYF